MKNYIFASESDDKYMYNMLRPLLEDLAEEGEEFLRSEGMGLDLNQLVDYIAQYVEATFEEMSYEDYLSLAKMYVKSTYKGYVSSSNHTRRCIPAKYSRTGKISSSTRSNRSRITASYRNYPGWDFIEETLLEEDLDCYDSRADFVDSLMGFFEDYRGVLEADGVDFDEIEHRVNEFWDEYLEE